MLTLSDEDHFCESNGNPWIFLSPLMLAQNHHHHLSLLIMMMTVTTVQLLTLGAGLKVYWFHLLYSLSSFSTIIPKVTERTWGDPTQTQGFPCVSRLSPLFHCDMFYSLPRIIVIILCFPFNFHHHDLLLFSVWPRWSFHPPSWHPLKYTVVG